MRARYRKYFLDHVLLLQDELATYYVQQSFSVEDQIPGIELKSFFDYRAAVDWITDCVSHDNFGMPNLRTFLDESSPHSYLLHQMDDCEVIDEAARAIMDYDFPVVVRPVFEPPQRQSELIDLLYEVRNSLSETGSGAGPASKRFQFKNLMANRWPDIPLDGSVLNNIKNMPDAVFNALVNALVVDVGNAFLLESQNVQDHGFKKWLSQGLKNQWGLLKKDTKKLEELSRKGPNELLWYLTSDALWKDVSNQLKGVFQAENWKNAFAIVIPAALLKKIGGGKRAGGGSRANAAQSGPNPKAKPEPDSKPKRKPEAKSGPKTTSEISCVLVENQPKSLKRVTSSGTRLVANPEKTTTVLGRYSDDMKDVLGELDYPKTLDFGEKKGGFNVLNTPDHLYKNADQFWNDYNKPFLDKAIDRGDDIVMATRPEITKLRNFYTGELTGFGREFEYLKSKGYKYDPGTNMMVRR